MPIRRTVVIPLLLALAACGVRPPQPSQPYNVVLVMADDLGAAELGCYGHPGGRTPALDRLAQEGTRFATCYATPLCKPSRVLVMTGQYGFRTGFWGNDKRYHPRPGSPMADIGAKTTFADLLHDAGYVCGITGKWHLSGRLPELVYDCGFDEYLIWGSRPYLPREVADYWHGSEPVTSRYWHPALLENGQYVATTDEDFGPDLYTDWAIDFVRRHRDERFFLYYPMCLVHLPEVAPPDPERPGQRLPEGPDSYVRYMDHCVGRIVAAIDELGLAERTVVIYTADNGTQDLGKGEATELGARVPFIARCPGTVAAGVESAELTDLADVLPTLVELAGARPPQDLRLDGKSLVPTLRDPQVPHGRDWVFSYMNDQRVVRLRQWLWESGSGLYFTGTSRDGEGYRFLGDGSGEPAAQRARERIDLILARLPAPQGRGPGRELRRDDWKRDWGPLEGDE